MDEEPSPPHSVTITATTWRPVTGRQGDEMSRRLAALLLHRQADGEEATDEAA